MMKRVWRKGKPLTLFVGMQTDTFTMENLWRFIKDLGIKPLLLFFSCSVMSNSLQPHGLQHARLPCPSPSLFKLMSIESMMPSNHLVLCHSLLLLPSIFPSSKVFSNESVFHIRWPKYWSSVSASVLPMNIQDWFPLGWTAWISLQSKGLSKVSYLSRGGKSRLIADMALLLESGDQSTGASASASVFPVNV